MMMNEFADQSLFLSLEIVLRAAVFPGLPQRIWQCASAMAEYVQLGTGLNHKTGDESLMSDAGVCADHQSDGLVQHSRPESGR